MLGGESFDRETDMLQLYFWPMACSLASRIALMEAGIEARYHLVHLWTKKVLEDDSDFRAVSPKGAVPVLVLENGERLTENAAVLQYIADLKPELGLAPRPGEPDRYRLEEWLSFVGSEIHKAFLFPTFWYKDEAGEGRRARTDRQEFVGRSRASCRPALSRRRTLYRGGCLSHLVAAAARTRRRRYRGVAVAGDLPCADAATAAAQGGDRYRDAAAENNQGVTDGTECPPLTRKGQTLNEQRCRFALNERLTNQVSEKKRSARRGRRYFPAAHIRPPKAPGCRSNCRGYRPS